MEEKLSIRISFKRKEKELYEYIKSKGDQSNYLKDLVKADIQGYMPVASQKSAKPSNTPLAISDILGGI